MSDVPAGDWRPRLVLVRSAVLVVHVPPYRFR